MPYRDPEKKREWERTHRSERTRERLRRFETQRALERAEHRIPPVEVSERLAAGGEEEAAVWKEYEASLGLGNPEQDEDILGFLRKRRR